MNRPDPGTLSPEPEGIWPVHYYKTIAHYPTGCYQLGFELRRQVKLRIGSLGVHFFQPGIYIYTGRHQSNLPARIIRHLKVQKKIRWHVDYLTTHSAFDKIFIVIYPETNSECLVNQASAKAFRAGAIPAGFGSSDCRAGCGGHLLYMISFEKHLMIDYRNRFRNAHFIGLDPRYQVQTD